MDQNQTIDNDLQKAIDDITQKTSADPVFADPVAAPSSVPEGDTGELGDPVGPFAEPTVNIPAPESSPVATTFDTTVPPMPDYSSEVPMPASVPPSAPLPPAPDVLPPAPVPPQVTPEPISTPPIPEPMPMSEPSIAPEAPHSPSSDPLNMRQVKEAALRDLVPLLGRLNMSPSQRFNICRNIFEDLRDYGVLDQAYRAATEIPDDTERAEALLYLVESIDKI